MALKKNDLIFILSAIILLFAGMFFSYSIVGWIITLVFGILAFLRPVYGVTLLFIYLPIRPFLIEYNPAMRAIADLIIFVLMIKVLWNGRKSPKDLVDFKVWEYAFFAFLLVGAVSAYLTGVSLVAIVFQLRSFVSFYLVYYVVRRLSIKKEDIVRLAWSLVFISIILIIQGIVEKLSVRSAFLPLAWEQLPLSAKNRIRIYGMLGNPNVFGIFLSFAFALFLYIRRFVQGKAVWGLNIMLALTAGLLILTYSRGTWIAFGIAFVIYILGTRNWRLILTVVKITVISGILVVLPINLLTDYIEKTESGSQKVGNIQQFDEGGESSFSDRMGSTFSDDTISGSRGSGRLYIVEKGFEIFQNNPIIGTGFATYGDSSTLSNGSPIYEKYNVRPEFYSDNQYIQIIVQTGVIGVLLFAVFLLGMLKDLWNRRKESRYYIYMIGILLSGYFMGLVYNLWESDIWGLIFFSMLGVAFHKTKNIQKQWSEI
ncbi:O-antigen ligase family protein [Jeotgalibacillus proteolyticus]|uniref:O-antigen ligase family protein n=1 Tax=Jeotgalibacillus proteolyticus TaxID=2082395 RepID=UPI003CF5F259